MPDIEPFRKRRMANRVTRTSRSQGRPGCRERRVRAHVGARASGREGRDTRIDLLERLLEETGGEKHGAAVHGHLGQAYSQVEIAALRFVQTSESGSQSARAVRRP